MNTLLNDLRLRAQDCTQLFSDIDLIRPVTYETDPTPAQIAQILNGTAALYDLRFAELSKLYDRSVAEAGFFHYEIEECIMQWWGACNDLRCATEGATLGLLDNDGLDNILLGVRSMALVRSTRFFTLFDARVPQGDASPSAPSGDTAP